MKNTDQALCERIFSGDNSARKELKEKHTGLVIIICKDKLEAGGLHEDLSIDYNVTIQDLSMIIWNEIFKQVEKGIKFTSEHSFKNLLRKIATCRAVDVVRESLKHRTQGALRGINNSFPRLKDAPEALLLTSDSPEVLLEVEEKLEVILPMLLKRLEKKELDVFNFMKNFIQKNNRKPTQAETAASLGVTERTIRTRMKNITKKANEFV